MVEYYEFQKFCGKIITSHDFIYRKIPIMSPPEGLGDILFFPGRPDVRLSVCLSRIVSAL